MGPIVEVEWLNEHLFDPNVRIIDCRFSLADPKVGLEAYIQGHIPNALFFDLEKDLAGIKKEHGGRHPIPDLTSLVEKLEAAGINEQVKVVAYDDQGGMFASRFWWLLRYLGHEQVAILNGGFSKWIDGSYQVTTEVPQFKKSNFTAKESEEMVINAHEIYNRLTDDSLVLLDSREEKRYLGIEEPIDNVAGHIPGAKHFFWKNNLDDNGYWKETAEVQSYFESLPKEGDLVVYCGSGITACPNVLALNRAGFTNVKLYVGSWSDWISHPTYPIEKNE